MRFGISSFAFAWSIGVPGYPLSNPMGVHDLLSEIARLGAETVQFGDNLPLHRLSTDERRKVREHAQELGLSIEVGARGLTAQNLETYIQIAEEMGSPILRFVIDQNGYEPSMDEVESEIRRVLSRLSDVGIRLAIENHDRFPVSVYVILLESLGSDHVGICLDTVNSFGAGQDYETVLGALAPYTINLHVKDFVINRVPHQMGFIVSGAPAGVGILPIGQLLEVMDNLGRCQTAVLETWPTWEGSIEATILKERQWAEISSQYLRKALVCSANNSKHWE